MHECALYNSNDGISILMEKILQYLIPDGINSKEYLLLREEMVWSCL